MSARLGWLLLLGGLAAALVGMFALPPGDALAVIVFGGLAAVILGAIALLVVRMSGTEGTPPGPASLPAGRAQGQGQAKAAGAERAPAASRRLGIATTWAVLGAIYYLSGTPGNGSWLVFMAGLLMLAALVGIVAAIASRVFLGRAWGWAVSIAIAGTGFVAGLVVGALIAAVLGG